MLSIPKQRIIVCNPTFKKEIKYLSLRQVFSMEKHCQALKIQNPKTKCCF